MKTPSFIKFNLQFFDSNVDGVVTEADLTHRLPFKSFPYIPNTAERVQGGEVGNNSLHCGDEGTLSEEMNLGEN